MLEEGREDGSLRFTGSARETARSIVSSLEGAMLVARPYGDLERFKTAAARLLASLAEPVSGWAAARCPPLAKHTVRRIPMTRER